MNNDLHAMKPYWWSNPFNCRDWCNNDDRCGGFFLNNAQCIFKSYACGHNLIYIQTMGIGEIRRVYLKQGSSVFTRECFQVYAIDVIGHDAIFLN